MGFPETRQWELNRWVIRKQLANKVNILFSGQWHCIELVHPMNVSVEGTFTGTITVLGSNAVTTPLAADVAKPIIGTMTDGSSAVADDKPWMWIKVLSTDLASVDGVDVYVAGAQNAT